MSNNFMRFCSSCLKNHRMTLKPCPSCGGRGDWTPQPVSDKVAAKCYANYQCDGCVAYEDRYR